MTSLPSAKKMKKADMTAQAELEARDFDIQTQKLLEDIDTCQNELEALNEQASDEIISVEQRFTKLRKPYIERRTELIKQVPQFWATAFTNHPDLSSLITTDSEEDCFHHLTRVEVVESEDIKSGFRIEFHFTENPYFHNNILVKEYQLGTQGMPASVSTAIEWREGMNLLPHRDVNDGVMPRKRKLQNQSFFEWFNDHFDPTGDNIADIIKDDLWQTPLQYFLTPDVEMNNGLDDDDEEEEESSVEEDEEAEIPQVDNQIAPGADPLE